MTSDMSVDLVIACFPLAAMLLTIAEWSAFRIARTAWSELSESRVPVWTRNRVLACAGLVTASLAAFPLALYAFWASFFVSWQILWPTAAAFVATGLAGVATAGTLLVKPLRRPILIALAGLANIALLLWASYTLIAAPRVGVLPEWMQPGVRSGTDYFDKKVFLTLDNIGTVTDIERVDLRSSGLSELGIAGNYGARLFESSGKEDAVIRFAVRTPGGFRVSADIVEEMLSGRLLFFRQAGAAATYDSLVDGSGNEMWRTPYIATGSAFGDLTGNKVPEFIFARPDYTIEARDLSGATLWQTPPAHTVFKIALVKRDRGLGSDILVDESGSVVLLGPHGDLHFRLRVPTVGYFSDFTPMDWPGVCEPQCLLVASQAKFLLLTTDGATVLAGLAAPDADYLDAPRTVAVRLFRDAPPLLAVAWRLLYKGEHRAGLETIHGTLYLFDSQKHLVYHEVLPEPVEALGTLSTPDGETETLLVGGDNKVWQYSASQTGILHKSQ